MDNRVVVTGLGAVTPIENAWQKTWSGLKDGRSGLAWITHFGPAGLPTHIAIEVKGFDPNAASSVKQTNRMSRASQFAVTLDEHRQSVDTFATTAEHGVIIACRSRPVTTA